METQFFYGNRDQLESYLLFILDSPFVWDVEASTDNNGFPDEYGNYCFSITVYLYQTSINL